MPGHRDTGNVLDEDWTMIQCSGEKRQPESVTVRRIRALREAQQALHDHVRETLEHDVVLQRIADDLGVRAA